MFDKFITTNKINTKKLSKYCKNIKGILYQDFETTDDVIKVITFTYGFWGGGIHKYHHFEVYKNDRKLFITRSYDFLLAYLNFYVKKYKPPIRKKDHDSKEKTKNDCR